MKQKNISVILITFASEYLCIMDDEESESARVECIRAEISNIYITSLQRCRLRSFFKSCAHIGFTSQLKTLRFFLQILYELCVTYFQSQIGDG